MDMEKNMAQTAPKKYSEDFKIRAAWLVIEGIQSVTTASKILNISRSSLSRWVEQYKDDWDNHKNLLYRDLNLDETTDKNRSLCITRSLLSNRDISIEEHRKLQMLVAQQASASERNELFNNNSANSTQESNSLQNSNADTSTSLSPDKFNFSRGKKDLFNVVFILSVLAIFSLSISVYIHFSKILLGSKLGEFIFAILDCRGTLFEYFFEDLSNPGLGKVYIFLIIFRYATPLLIINYYFRLRSYKNNQSISNHNSVINSANNIILAQYCGIITVTLNPISIIYLIGSIILISFLFWDIISLQEIKEK